MMNQLHTQESKGFCLHPPMVKKQKSPSSYTKGQKKPTYLLRQRELIFRLKLSPHQLPRVKI